MSNIVQLIKQEIERQIDYAEDDTRYTESYREGLIAAYQTIKAFIDSLPEEPVSEDLDFQTFAEEMHSVFALPSSETKNTEEDPLKWEYAIARHFAEWGINHIEDKSEMVCEDLEEEIDRYYSDWQFDEDTIYEDMRDICRHFAEWQKKKDQETIELAEDHAMLAGMNKMKEEMMKNAVDAGVYQGLYSKYVKESDDEALANVLKNYNSGDKVKIIIIKTEQQ